MTATTTTGISDDAAAAAIDAACKTLHLPTVRADAGPLADAATRDRITHRGYLAELLAAETDARRDPPPPTPRPRSPLPPPQDPRRVRPTATRRSPPAC